MIRKLIMWLVLEIEWIDLFGDLDEDAIYLYHAQPEVYREFLAWCLNAEDTGDERENWANLRRVVVANILRYRKLIDQMQRQRRSPSQRTVGLCNAYDEVFKAMREIERQ